MNLDYSNYILTVIDNNSTDRSIELVRGSFPMIKILSAGSNVGYAGGNALALPDAVASQADLFWVVNPDAIVESSALSALVDCFERHGEALYGGIPLFRPNGRDPWQVGLRSWAVDAEGQPDLNMRLTYEGDYATVFKDTRERVIASLSGASLLIPISVIAKYGFMDSDFFLYSEETDYSLRLARHQIRSFLVPSSIVYHQPQGAHKHHRALKPVVIYYQTRNRLTVIRRYGSLSLYRLALLRALISVPAWIVSAPVTGLASFRIAGFTLLAIYHAMRHRLGPTFVPKGPETG